MKYFAVTLPGDSKETILGSAGDAKRFLLAHPEIPSVVRYWWVGRDLIDVEEVPRETVLKKTVRQLNQGARAQWAVSHRKL